MQAVLRGEGIADVPCGECVGCCVSSYPIPLRPADQVALDQLPPEYLLRPATPGVNALMGFRADGSCPMLKSEGCSVYADRPGTCRDYDCRIYAAAGLLPDGDRPVIQKRVQAWQFEYADEQAEVQAQALRAAAAFIRKHSDRFPAGMRAASATAAAVLAVKAWPVFLEDNVEAHIADETEIKRRVLDVIEAVRQFDGSAIEKGASRGP